MVISELVPLLVACATAGALILLLWLDRYTVEPVVPFFVAALFGAAAGWGARLAARAGHLVGMSGWGGEEVAGTADLLRTAVAAAPLPALLAAVAVAVLCRERRFPGLAEPVVIGVAPTLGAASVVALAGEGTRLAAAVAQLLWWAVSGATVGAVLGWGRGVPRRPWNRLLVALAPLGGIVVAALGGVVEGLRVGWSGGARGLLAWLGVVLPLCLLGLVVGGILAIEGRQIRAELGQEVALGVLPEWVVPLVSSYWKRAFGSWWVPRSERRIVARVLTTLAFRARAVRGATERVAGLRALEVGRLRQRARELLQLREASATTRQAMG
jgi:hypothetical protein